VRYDLDKGLAQLEPLVKQGNLIIFVGAGISVPSNLPNWSELLKKFVAFCRAVQDDLQLPPADRFDDLLSAADADTEKYPLRVASVLRDKLADIDLKHEANVQNLFRQWLLDIFYDAKFNDNHTTIVDTAYPYILTTNYDRLLELAARDRGHRRLYSNSFTFNDASKIAGAIHSKNPAIIHIHGNPQNIAFDDFVFTAEDYLRIRRKYPGFTLSLQALFMTYSILFVGYGGSDPHLEELLEELRYFFQWSKSPLLPKYFLFIQKAKAGKLLVTYKEKLSTQIIEVPDYSYTTQFLQELKKLAPRTAS
jgi:hypothetical protein